MWPDEAEENVHVNWTAILSFTGCVASSLAIWVGLIRMVQHLVK